MDERPLDLTLFRYMKMNRNCVPVVKPTRPPAKAQFPEVFKPLPVPKGNLTSYDILGLPATRLKVQNAAGLAPPPSRAGARGRGSGGSVYQGYRWHSDRALGSREGHCMRKRPPTSESANV